MSDGFLQPTMKNWFADPGQQAEIKEQLTSLAGTKTYIIHPKRQKQQADGSIFFKTDHNTQAKCQSSNRAFKKLAVQSK